ncbi:MAG: hypothetical protein K1X28_08665 [Parachlamydiales bacterium]|nr:hypothetical protein [Parachlamydiales bacterium]
MSKDINWNYPPNVLSTSGSNASATKVAMDASGNAVAVWLENGVVKAKSKLVSNNWGTIATLSGTGASSPTVVSDSNGNATAVWLENGVVKASTKTLSGNWTAATSLSGTNASSPCLAVSAAGDVIAGWVRAGDVQTSTKLFGGSWGNAATITGSSANLPQIAIGGTGSNATAAIVYQDLTTGINVVYGSTKTVSGTWSAKTIISDTKHQAGNSRVAVDKSGNVMAIWYAYDVAGSNYSGVTLQAASKPFGGSWGTFSSVSQKGIKNPANLDARVCYDGLGNAIAVWGQSFNDETYYIQSSIKSVDFFWSQPINLVEESLFAYDSDVNVSSFGDAVALFMFYNGSQMLIQSSQLDITGFMDSVWSVPGTISLGSKNAFPSVAMAVSGNVLNTVAVWVSSNGVNTSVNASTGSLQLLLPPSGLTVTQNNNNYGVFTEYYNTLSWQASTDANVVGYLIYRNGVFLKQVGANMLSFVDENRVQNGAVTYGVASIDDQNNHSRIITVSFP